LICCANVDTTATIQLLGIPLTIRRPTAAQLQPLVDKMAGKLPCWKSRLMQKPGRLALAKSVLGAIPLHQLLVLAPPKTILKMEKIEKASSGRDVPLPMAAAAT
jgi:hypothetical protein